MSTGRVICENPNTLTGILPFFPDKEFEKRVPEYLKDIEHLFVNDITPITLTNEEIDKIRKKFVEIEDGKIYHNGQQYSYEKDTTGKVNFRLVEDTNKPIYYKDGVLQDTSTGELFYFLAIDSYDTDREVFSQLIDEGTILNYKRQYRGIGEIRLHKMNNRYYYEENESNFEKYKDSLELYDNPSSSHEDTDKGVETAKDIISYKRNPKLEGEIVRFVEIVGVKDYPGLKRKS